MNSVITQIFVKIFKLYAKSEGALVILVKFNRLNKCLHSQKSRGLSKMFYQNIKYTIVYL